MERQYPKGTQLKVIVLREFSPITEEALRAMRFNDLSGAATFLKQYDINAATREEDDCLNYGDTGQALTRYDDEAVSFKPDKYKLTDFGIELILSRIKTHQSLGSSEISTDAANLSNEITLAVERLLKLL